MIGVLHILEDDLREAWIGETLAAIEDYLAKWAELVRRYGP